MAQRFRFPSIDALRAFEAAARLGSFERAGDELDVGASAIGKRLATLEDLLGTPLFERGTKSLTLSASGIEYLEQVRGALALLAAMPLHQHAAQRVQRLRVVAPPTFARQILMPQLAAFTAHHPEVELELQLSVPFAADAAPMSADVEVRYGDADEGDELLREPVLPLASPHLLARLPTIAHAADLKPAPLLRTPLQPWAPWFRAAGLDWPEPTGGPKLLDLGLALEAAVAGQGVALARPSLACAWLRARCLLPVLRLSTQASRRYQLRLHGGGVAGEQFSAWLRTRCEQAAREGAEELSRCA